MKSIVVYYSLTNKTEYVSTILSKTLNLDTFRLIEKKNRKGLFGFLFGGFDALMAKRSELESMPILKKYGLILIGTPIWAGRVSPAILSFLDNASLKGKKVVVFCTMAGDDAGSVLNTMASIVQKKGGKLIYMFGVKTGKRNTNDIKKISLKFALQIKSLLKE